MKLKLTENGSDTRKENEKILSTSRGLDSPKIKIAIQILATSQIPKLTLLIATQLLQLVSNYTYALVNIPNMFH